LFPFKKHRKILWKMPNLRNDHLHPFGHLLPVYPTLLLLLSQNFHVLSFVDRRLCYLKNAHISLSKFISEKNQII
jgi:hypothetical protein